MLARARTPARARQGKGQYEFRALPALSEDADPLLAIVDTYRLPPDRRVSQERNMTSDLHTA